MKKIILAATLSLVTTMAFAGATLDSSKDTNAKGSLVGQSSSSYTGNGDVIGGNGATATANPSRDQTQGANTRSNMVHGVQDGSIQESSPPNPNPGKGNAALGNP